MQYEIKKAFPGWSTLSGLGNSALIKSFSIWFVIIPILAKITEGISGEINLGLFSPPLVIQWDIPFSFKVLYLATVLFTLANIIYTICAPKIIKEYKSYSDFKEKEGSFESLKQMFEPLLERSSSEYKEILLKDFFDHVHTTESKSKWDTGNSLRERFDACTVPKEYHAEAYSNIKGAYNEENSKSQACIIALYMMGFLCLAYLFVENAIYVFRGVF